MSLWRYLKFEAYVAAAVSLDWLADRADRVHVPSSWLRKLVVICIGRGVSLAPRSLQEDFVRDYRAQVLATGQQRTLIWRDRTSGAVHAVERIVPPLPQIVRDGTDERVSERESE